MHTIKLIFISFIVLSCSLSHAQLITVYAEGGDETNLDWRPIKEQEDKEAQKLR